MEKNVKAELLVVDDHNLILEGICKVVNKMPEVVVVDAVTSGLQAAELIERRDYDIYILDVSIPDMSGFELIAKIREMNDQAKIIVNTMHEEIWIVNRLVQCGVNAVILKSSASAVNDSYSLCVERRSACLSTVCCYLAETEFCISRFAA